MPDVLDTSSFTDLFNAKDIAILKEIRLAEEVAHHKAYDKNKPSVISLLEEDDINRQYRIIPLSTGTDRIYGEIYVPIDPKTNQRVYVNFRGTQDFENVVADLEDCPGEKSFQRHKDAIMAQVNKAIGEVAQASGKRVETIFSGHSLGGALAQMAATEAMHYQAYNLYSDLAQDSSRHLDAMSSLVKAEQAYLEGFNKKYPSIAKERKGPQGMPEGIPEAARGNFRQVSTIKVMTMNSAGVSHIIENYSNQVAPVLAKHGTKLVARYALIDKDGVQRTGQGTALSDAPAADVAVTKLYPKVGQENKSTLKQALLAAGSAFVAGLALGPAAAAVAGLFGFAVGGLKPTLDGHLAFHFLDQKTNGDVATFPRSNFEIFRNDTPEGHKVVKSKLQNKAAVLQNPLLKKGQSLLYAFASKISKWSKAEKSPDIQPVTAKTMSSRA